MKNMSVNRRTVLTGTVALGTVGLLAACGKKADMKDAGTSASSADEAVKNVKVNEQPHSNLKQGGILNLAQQALGPNFNTMTQSGYTASNILVMSAVNVPSGPGFFNLSPAGEASINTDFLEEYKAETKDGVQTITLKLNKKAKFNDGTPMDIDAIRAMASVYAADSPFADEVYANEQWANAGTIEEVDGDKFHVKVTSKKPYYPADYGMYSQAVHPAVVASKEMFTDGFNSKVENFKYFAGPYKVESWNSSEKTLTFVPNENWWGENKGMLDKIVWRQMDSEAQRAAVKNGELDAMIFSTAATYKNMQGVKGTEIRPGQLTSCTYLELNPNNIPDLALRRAIATAVNREQMAEIRFKELGWKETMPGSIIAMPWQKGYADAFSAALPASNSVEAAQKILEEAGYTKSGDFYAKDGKTAEFSLTTFGSDATTTALMQMIDAQMKKVGIKMGNDVQPASSYQTVNASKSFGALVNAIAITNDPTSSASYLFATNYYEGAGSKEIDDMIEKLNATESMDERYKLTQEIEKKYAETSCVYVPYLNGPDYYVVKSELANFGPALFKMAYNDAAYWTMVGWQK